MLRQQLLRSLILTAAIANVPFDVPLYAADADPTATTQPAAATANLPVTSVTLFSSGVGYFEHFGPVNGDGSAVLNFKTAQINDVLKSLVLEDLGGGTVSAVQYPSQDPVEKTLKSFGVDITENPPLADLLNQLRGASVTIESAGQSMHGAVMGVEKRDIAAKTDGTAISVWVLNLIDGATIHQIELAKVGDLKLDDPSLKDELGQALKALSQARDQDKKKVTIQFTGQGNHNIRLGYVVEAPVWKASYRLLLPDPKSEDKAAKPMIHGWAIVENQTDSDWSNVRLSLVSGRPISFMMDLYQPLYNPRPTMQLDLLKNLQAQVYAGGEAQKDAPMGGQAASPAPMEMRAMRQIQSAQNQSFDRKSEYFTDSLRDRLNSGVAPSNSAFQTSASTEQMGELFQYTVNNVTLPRQKSAMIPIVNDPIEVEKLSIYNASVLPRNPLNGVMLTNTTDKHLLQGPITVYENGYAGDAQIENLPPGQKRLLSYGVDLQTLVDVDHGDTNSIVGGKIVKGVLQLNRKMQQSNKYSIQNKADHDKTIVIEQPIRQQWSLTDTPEPMEKTDTLYRFKVAVAKSETKTFNVTEQFVQEESMAILADSTDDLIVMSHNGGLPDKVRTALTQAVAKRQAYEDLTRQVTDKDTAIAAIGDEQKRLRDDLAAVEKNTPYANRLLTKLNDQETQIEKLQTDRDDIRKQADQAKQAWTDFVQGLDLE